MIAAILQSQAEGPDMARKTKKSPKPARTAKSKSKAKSDLPGRIIDAALALAVSRGWRRIRLADIAAEAGVTVAELSAVFSSKSAIIGGFVRRTDERVLAGGEAEGSSARDRLFDVLMRRFDALQPHRQAVAAILGVLVCDPLAPMRYGPGLMCSMARMLKAAGLSSKGPGGALRAKGLAVVYMLALRAWLTDDSADLAKTMAVLDRGLRQAESLVTLLCPGGARRSA